MPLISAEARKCVAFVVTDHIGDVSRGIHSGIGVIVPVQKIIETVEHPELVEMRKAKTGKRKPE